MNSAYLDTLDPAIVINRVMQHLGSSKGVEKGATQCSQFHSIRCLPCFASLDRVCPPSLDMVIGTHCKKGGRS